MRPSVCPRGRETAGIPVVPLCVTLTAHALTWDDPYGSSPDLACRRRQARRKSRRGLGECGPYTVRTP
jgi:hypothetical protein